MKTQRSADIYSGFFLTLLGLVVLISASQITGGLEERLPPRTLPYTMGVLITCSGALLAVRSWRLRGGDIPIKWPDRKAIWRIAVCLIALVFYIALMDPLGLPLSTFLYISFSVWFLARHRILYALLIGLASGAASYLIFIYLLELSFPVGPFLER